MRRDPPWIADVRLPRLRPLAGNVRADVCVVGAGIGGLTTAYLLALAGKSVVVLEDGEIGSGMTRLTTAHLSGEIDDGFVEIERLHGASGAKVAAQSHTAAVNRIDAIAAKEGIDCDFRRVTGYLFAAPEHGPDTLNEELAAARRAGHGDAVLVERAPLEGFDTGPSIAFPNQAQIHPLKYLAGLAGAVKRNGGRIFGGTHADAVEGGRKAQVRAGERRVDCKAVVVATNSPINDRVAIHTKQAPYMTYVIAARMPKGAVPLALYWDTHDPYHYVRVHEADDHDLLIVGGEDHKSGQADDTTDRWGRLEAWARERFHAMEGIEYAWAGQVMETIDGLGYIGRNPLDDDNVYVVTGDSGMGMTHGTLAGILITDLILDRRNPWADTYDPSRKTVRAVGTFAKEAANMAAQYADWARGGEVDSVEEIANDSGALLRRGSRLVAAYRDPGGRLHEYSAVCPHLGCIVHWNAAARTWDCPCHGSRFDREGKVVNGPANSDLEPAREPRRRTG